MIATPHSVKLAENLLADILEICHCVGPNGGPSVVLEHDRCLWGFGHWSSQAIPQMFSVPTLMVFLNYGSLLPLFCSGQGDSAKAANPEPKDQATLLLLQVSAVSPVGQEWHLFPDLERSDSPFLPVGKMSFL